jgi:hypothetical protein
MNFVPYFITTLCGKGQHFFVVRETESRQNCYIVIEKIKLLKLKFSWLEKI